VLGRLLDVIRDKAQKNKIVRRLFDITVDIAISRSSIVRKLLEAKESRRHLVSVINNIDKLVRLYTLLADNYSQQTLTAILKFRVLGQQHAKLPLNSERYWANYSYIDKYLIERRSLKPWKLNCWLNRYKIPGDSGPIQLHCLPLNILQGFILEQYAYKKGDRVIQVRPGDIVIDAGSCWGDSTLYFADKVGIAGRVYSFEFAPENLQIFYNNINLNPQLAERIEVVSKALWNNSGGMLPYYYYGPATSILDTKPLGKLLVSTVTIDDFVKAEGIARIDFIKMDIEGSELRALQGAEETIRRFRPRLAISVYHRPDDLFVIPEYLDNLGLHYELLMDHFSTNAWETVVYAGCKDG